MIFATHDCCSEAWEVAAGCAAGFRFEPRGGNSELRHGLLQFQVGHAQPVSRRVGRGPQVSHLLDLPAADVAHFPQPARLLQPAKDLFHLLARPLTELIGPRLHAPQHAASGIPFGTRRGDAFRRDGDVGLDFQILFERLQKLARLVTGVPSQGPGLAAVSLPKAPQSVSRRTCAISRSAWPSAGATRMSRHKP